MSKHIFSDNGKRIVCDTSIDDQIYDAPHNPPNTGTRYTRGTDIYAHKAKSGAVYFYARHWSMWQGEEERVELMGADEVRDFFDARMNGDYHARPSDEEIAKLSEYGIELFDETA